MGTRRELLLGLGATFLVGCTAPQSPTSREQGANQPSQITQSANPEKTAQPTLEQRVRTIGIDVWRSLLSQNQRINISPPNSNPKILEFRTTILNPEVWDTNLFSQVASGKKIDVPLKMRWIALSSSNYQNSWLGERWTGEVEFNNISIAIIGSAPKDDASKANKIDWAGGIDLKFIENGHSVIEEANKGMSQADFQKWLSSRPPDLPRISEAVNSGFGILLTIKDGQPKVDPPYYAYSGATALSLILKRFHLPSAFLQGCNQSLSCKIVQIK